MKVYVKASRGSSKVTAKNWNDFCDEIQRQFGFSVGSMARRRPSRFVEMVKAGEIYEGEVTHYSDGTYELLLDNIYEVNDDEYEGW